MKISVPLTWKREGYFSFEEKYEKKRATAVARRRGRAFPQKRKKLLCPREGTKVYFSLTKSTKSQKEESIPLLNTFCRLAATRANILSRQSDRRLNRKRSSDPRLTRTLVYSDFSLSCPNSMSIKLCSLGWSLAYSGKRIKSHGRNQPTPSNLLAFCGILCSHARYD